MVSYGFVAVNLFSQMKVFAYVYSNKHIVDGSIYSMYISNNNTSLKKRKIDGY